MRDSPFQTAMDQVRATNRMIVDARARLLMNLRMDHCWVYGVIERARAFPTLGSPITNG